MGSDSIRPASDGPMATGVYHNRRAAARASTPDPNPQLTAARIRNMRAIHDTLVRIRDGNIRVTDVGEGYTPRADVDFPSLTRRMTLLQKAFPNDWSRMDLIPGEPFTSIDILTDSIAHHRGNARADQIKRATEAHVASGRSLMTPAEVGELVRRAAARIEAREAGLPDPGLPERPRGTGERFSLTPEEISRNRTRASAMNIRDHIHAAQGSGYETPHARSEAPSDPEARLKWVWEETKRLEQAAGGDRRKLFRLLSEHEMNRDGVERRLLDADFEDVLRTPPPEPLKGRRILFGSDPDLVAEVQRGEYRRIATPDDAPSVPIVKPKKTMPSTASAEEVPPPPPSLPHKAEEKPASPPETAKEEEKPARRFLTPEEEAAFNRGPRKASRMSVRGALLGQLSRARMIQGAIEFAHEPTTAGGAFTAASAVQEGVTLSEAVIRSRADAMVKAAKTALEAGQEAEAAALSARAAYATRNAAALAQTGRVLGAVMGPIGAGMELYSAAETESPAMRATHIGMAVGGTVETLLMAGGSGAAGPVGQALAVTGLTVMLVKPVAEAQYAINQSNDRFYSASTSMHHLGDEAGVKAETLPPRIREFKQLDRFARKYNELHPEKLREHIEKEMAELKASPDWADSRSNARLRVQYMEGALKELGSKPGETFTFTSTDETGRETTHTVPTYASRYYAARKVAEREPERSDALMAHIDRLIGEGPQADIPKSLLEEQAHFKAELNRLARMEEGDRHKYLKRNAEFLRENGIPPHSPLADALVTYDNLPERAAFAGVSLKDSGLDFEMEEVRKAAGANYREVMEKVKPAVTESFMLGDTKVIALRGEYLTPEDRSALAHVAARQKRRGLTEIVALVDPTAEQLKKLKENYEQLRHERRDKGRAAMQSVLADMASGKATFTPSAFKRKPDAQTVERMLESSDDIAKTVTRIMYSGDARAIGHMARHLNISDEALTRAGIPVDSHKPQFQADFAKAFHGGLLTAEYMEGPVRLDERGARREQIAIYVFRGNAEEAKAFQSSLREAGIDFTARGNALEGYSVHFTAADTEKMVQPELAHARILGTHVPSREESRASGGRAEALVAQLDRDGDRRITERDFDLDGSGSLSAGEQKRLRGAYEAVARPENLGSEAAQEAVKAMHEMAGKFGVSLSDSDSETVSPGKGPKPAGRGTRR